VQRVILAAISTPEASATRDNGYGPVGVPLDDIYRELYGTDEPTDAQRQSVAHAVRRLGPEAVVQSYHGSRERPREQTIRYRTNRRAACRISEGACKPCRYGNRAEPLSKGCRDWFATSYGDRAEPYIAIAERNGVHTWTDYEADKRETTQTVNYDLAVHGLSRPRTEQEKTTNAESWARLTAQFDAAMGR